MSGPKVVRIVTREEVLALCEGQLARLDAAIEEWRRVGRRNDSSSEAEIAATESRRAKLRRLLDQERFLELQKAVPEEIAFLQADQASRLAQVAAAAAEARTTKRRAQSAAASLLSALERADAPVPPELRRELESAAAGQGEPASAISHGFALLSRDAKPAVTEHQLRLAQELKDADDRHSFRDWLATNAATTEDDGLTRLEQRVAELGATLGETATLAFEERLRQLAAESDSLRRFLLLDSLELDLAQAVAGARQRLALQGRLRLLCAELGAAGTEMSCATAETILAQIDGPTGDLERLEMDGSGVLERVRVEAAARARRQAVLRGLAGLGYQVTEGLETAWVRDGRVVLRKSSQPEYGVELGGGANSTRLQVRTVAFRDPASPADPSRDRDAETIWCGELSSLQAQLAAAGGGIVIERAKPVGVEPLKVVPDLSRTVEDLKRERPAAPRQRALD